jgi:hypothetical protein
MPNRFSTRGCTTGHRFLRSAVVRWLVAVVLVPVLVLGVFGGTTVLAHTHSDHGLHLHVSTAFFNGGLCEGRHRLAHSSDGADCGDHRHVELGCTGIDAGPSDLTPAPEHPVPAQEPDGVLITVPDHEHFAARGLELARAIRASHLFRIASGWIWNPPGLWEDIGSPGGRRGGARFDAPLHMASLTAVGRLVRTSGALRL